MLKHRIIFLCRLMLMQQGHMLVLTRYVFVGEVTAEGQDSIKQHPLRPAIMAAIGAAAERDR